MNAHRMAVASLFAAATIAAVCGSATAASPDAQVMQLLGQSRAALGGDALGRIKILQLESKGTAAGLPGTGTSWNEMGGLRFAETNSNPPIVGADGYDGTDVWNRDGSGLVWVDGGQAGRAQELTTAFAGNYALWSANRGGATVTWGGTQMAGGKNYDVLNVTAPGSAVPFAYWFDKTTHLPMRITMSIGPTSFTSTLTDYRPVQGVMIPYASHNESSDGNSADSVVTNAIANPDDGASHLVKPPSNVHDFSIGGGKSQTSVPFDIFENHVYLSVMLNGKGPYRFIYDTGGANIVDAAVAQEIGAAGTGSVQGSGVGATTQSFSFANVKTMQIGDALVKDQLFGVAPTRLGFGMSGGQPVDGLIGFEVLSRFVTTFDYANSQVVLQMPGPALVPPCCKIMGGPPDSMPETLPFVLDGRQPQFACTIDSIAGQCTLDTGSRAGISLFTPFIAAHSEIVPRKMSAVGVNGFGVGGPALGRLGRLRSYGMGRFTIPNVVGDFSTQIQGAFAQPFIAGNVGGALLKRFTMTLDYGRQSMLLAPNASFHDPDVYERAGLFLLNRAGKYVVLDVRPQTPAAQAGIVKGDTIASINGKPATGMTLAQVRQMFFLPSGTVLQIGLTAKGGTQRTVSLTLRDFV